MASKESDRIAAFLADQAGTGPASAQVTDALVEICRGVEQALTPVIGPRGVAALWRRSLHVAARSHAWLAQAAEVSPTGIDLAALRSLLDRQSGAQAACAGGVILQTFHDLLTSLIGKSLSERLLRAVWAPLLDTSTPTDDLP